MIIYCGAPEACDICQASIETEFIDGSTRMGPWANMCPSCYQQFGVGLGTGRGQHYAKQADGTFAKIAG